MKLIYKSCFGLLSCFCLVNLGWSQEYVKPLLFNQHLFDGKHVEKLSANTFDSTFIYTTDTLKVDLMHPILDDFSTDKFQHYSSNYADPSVTSQKYFKLMNKDGLTPLAPNARYHNQITVRRTYDPIQNSLTVNSLTADTIRYSDLSVYPPVYSVVAVYPPYDLLDTVGSTHPADTSYLPNVYYVQDSATQFFAHSLDSNAIWLDKYAFHNYTVAKNPWTLGVVTFDGLDENGYPYLINSTAEGYADRLTSKPIDLSNLNPSSEVYLSFLYQKEGFGDAPEPEDSLILQFYAPINQQWYNVWSVNGGGVSDFKKAHLKLDNPAYFGNGFQMRFINYGRLAGNLDNFHLDYVYLRAGSGVADTLFKDFAFVYPITTFLKDYTSVPWDHYRDHPTGKMSNKVQIAVRNGSNVPENSQNGLAWIEQNHLVKGSYVLSDYELTNHDIATNYAPLTTYFSYHDFSSGYRFDENTPGDYQHFDLRATATVPFSQLTINDSTFGSQIFSNYYAYDDGSAEQAYGINGAQAMLAYEFIPYEADSVIGASICFVPTVEDVTDKMFLLTIWDDNNGKPGQKIYEDDFFYPRNPVYGFGHNSFVNYFTKDTMRIPVIGKFYIGWRQLEDANLCVGLDRNIDQHDKIFYSTDNGYSWVNSGYAASLMIRPIFSTSLNSYLGVKEKALKTINFKAYPNPTDGKFTIDAPLINYSGALLFDISGTLLKTFSADEKAVDISDLKEGVYLLKESNTGNIIKILKQ